MIISPLIKIAVKFANRAGRCTKALGKGVCNREKAESLMSFAVINKCKMRIHNGCASVSILTIPLQRSRLGVMMLFLI